jgi:alpha-N-arabinofuranosidase
MDMYDPTGRIALIVDEWGTWYQVEPGTHPRFLYQQNTMRDAIVAAVSLDVFNRHCDRVRMANIAQTVNVLQAMILTQKDQMLLTPSYHVFELYSVHQDATMVPVDVQSEPYAHAGFSVPALSASASVDASGRLHLSLSNANPHTDIPVQVVLRGMRPSKAQGRMLQGARMADHNTFEQPNTVAPRALTEVTVGVDALQVTLPKMSVAVIEIA